MKKNQNQMQTRQTQNENALRFHLNEPLVLFRPQFTRNLQIQLINQEVMIILSDPVWYIGDNYLENMWEQVFSYISESYCRKLYLINTRKQKIIDTIANIQFKLLKHLDLSNNQIMNVEVLSFLRLPKIKVLDLSQNKIKSIDSLRKSVWSCIQEINIQQNQINSMHKFSQFNLTSQQSLKFAIKFLQSENTCKIQDVSYLYAKQKYFQKTIINQENFSHFQIQQNRHKACSIIKFSIKKSCAIKRRLII